eukprot:m.139749 g.139749  ORF g.139749 m.139749 type:complete len:643 (+) comp30076_c0_seq1:606-2534(+)
MMMTAVEATTATPVTDHQSCSMNKGKQPMSTPIVESGETIANSHELNYKQFSRLHAALSNPRNASTTNTAQIVPWVYINSLHTNLTQKENIGIKSINLEGSAAAHVLDDTAFPCYNDLDIVFQLQSQDRVDLCKVRDVVLDTLTQMDEFAPCDRWGVLSKMWISPPRRRNTEDAWAIFTLGSPVSGSSIDLKFVQHLNRPYQFSVDSFYLDVTGLLGNKNFLSWVCPVQKPSLDDGKIAVVVDTPPTTQPRVFSWAQIASKKNQAKKVSVIAAAASPSSKTPTPEPAQETIRIIDGPEPHTLVKADCHYPDFDKALLHLKHKRICVVDEDELAQVRGGGLLKYITYTQRGFRDDESIAPTRLAKYMVTRFLMDFPPFETNQMGGYVQLQILADYVYSHICGPDIESARAKRHDFLKSLKHLVRSISAFVNYSTHLIDRIEIINMHFIPHPVHRDQDDSDSCSMTSENSEEVCDSSLLITPTNVTSTNTNTSTVITTSNASTNTETATTPTPPVTTTNKAPTIACDGTANTTTNTTNTTTKPPSFLRHCRSSSSSSSGKMTNTNKSLPGKSKTKAEFQTRRSKSLKERNSEAPATTTPTTTTTTPPVSINTPTTATNNATTATNTTTNGIAIAHASMLELQIR